MWLSVAEGQACGHLVSYWAQPHGDRIRWQSHLPPKGREETERERKQNGLISINMLSGTPFEQLCPLLRCLSPGAALPPAARQEPNTGACVEASRWRVSPSPYYRF